MASRAGWSAAAADPPARPGAPGRAGAGDRSVPASPAAAVAGAAARAAVAPKAPVTRPGQPRRSDGGRRSPSRPAGKPLLLSELAGLLGASSRRGEAELRGVSVDSRRVEPGDVFLAVRGGKADGHEFASEAARRGAVALVVERFLPTELPQLLVPSVLDTAGAVTTAVYGPRWSGLTLAGVTGTNGKTTTCHLLAACLGEPGRPAGQVGTTGVRLGERLLGSSVLTTPQPPELQEALVRLAEAGAAAVAVEVSSHGLARRRVDGLVFDVAVFTNLSPEHLDFHGDMEAYFAAKRRLFEPARCRRAVVCVDTEWGRRLADEVAVPLTTYGSWPGADVPIEVAARGLEGIEVALALPDGEQRITSPLIGAVNGANCAGAYLAALAAGIDPGRAAAAVATCAAPPGRFEVVSSAQDEGLVVVDYAHTPDALAALLETARRIAPGKVTFVLGARGGRYHAKRADMARVASGADAVVFTTDSPGEEDAAAIVTDLLAGVPGDCGRIGVEADRRRAIGSAVAGLGPSDAVLVTGRGHEAVQHFGSQPVVLDDRVVARFALGSRRPPAGPPGPPPEGEAGRCGVTVVIPARDAEATIAAAVSSALTQQPAPEEVIVVDDGSSDGTAELVAGFGAPVRLVQQAPLGPSAARNAGIAAASSAWIGFLDADDEWLPGKLAAQIAALAGAPGSVLCATGWVRPAPAGQHPAAALEASPPRPISHGELLVLNRFQTSTVLARRDALCRIGGFDAALDGSEDWDCWLRLAAEGPVLLLESPLVAYRDSAGGVSKDLGQVYASAIAAFSRQVELGAAASRQRELAAWHHLRFAVAFALAGDGRAARRCLRQLAEAGLLAAAVPATARLLAPFLLRRALRRAGGRRPMAGASSRYTPP